MTLSAVYLDECVDQRLSPALSALGHTVETARTSLMLRATDVQQLEFATAHSLIVITHNRRYFRRLHRQFQIQDRPHAGIIDIPESGPLPRLTLRAAMMLDWVATQGDPRSRLFSWGTLQELLEHGLRLSGYTERDVQLALGR